MQSPTDFLTTLRRLAGPRRRRRPIDELRVRNLVVVDRSGFQRVVITASDTAGVISVRSPAGPSVRIVASEESLQPDAGIHWRGSADDDVAAVFARGAGLASWGIQLETRQKARRSRSDA